MRDLAERMAARHFDIQAQLIFEMTDHSKTSMPPFARKWGDVSSPDKLLAVETFRRLLADPEIRRMMADRALGI